MRVDRKVVLLTGAGTGIGRSLARLLLREGARVVLTGRRLEKLKETLEGCPNAERALCVAADVTRYKELRQLVQRALVHYGCIDVLINNAGAGYGGAITDVSPQEVEYLMKVDLVGPIWLTQLAVPHLRQQSEAAVVNVSSLAGLVGIPNQAFYCGAKHGLHGFSQALRRELLGTPIKVLTVYPGGVESELMSEAVKQKMAEENFRMFDMMKADRAAEIILDGIRREAASIFVTNGPERALCRLNQWMPGIVDRRMVSMRDKIRNIVCFATESVRARTPLSETVLSEPE
jgi:short-subunit dehydrogenase